MKNERLKLQYLKDMYVTLIEAGTNAIKNTIVLITIPFFLIYELVEYVLLKTWSAINFRKRQK